MEEIEVKFLNIDVEVLEEKLRAIGATADYARLAFDGLVKRNI